MHISSDQNGSSIGGTVLKVRIYLKDELEEDDGPYCWAFPSPGKIEAELSCIFGEALRSGLSCSRVSGTACLHFGEVWNFLSLDGTDFAS